MSVDPLELQVHGAVAKMIAKFWGRTWKIDEAK
jgi:hypothetical protein